MIQLVVGSRAARQLGEDATASSETVACRSHIFIGPESPSPIRKDVQTDKELRGHDSGGAKNGESIS